MQILQLASYFSTTGMFDPDFLAEARNTHLDLFTSVPKILRLLIFYYFASKLWRKTAKLVTFKTAIKFFITTIIIWALIYLSRVALRGIPEGFPAIFLFMHFAWFLNLKDWIDPSLFSEFTYLGGVANACNLSQWITTYKLEYAHYLTIDHKIRSTNHLGELLNNLTSVVSCLFYFFSIADWFYWTVKWFAVPIFLLLPEWICPFVAPDTRFSYSAYMLRGSVLWVNVMNRAGKVFNETGIRGGDDTLVSSKEVVIEFLLNLINDFQYVLVY